MFKFRKRIFITTLVLALSLSACGSKETSETSESSKSKENNRAEESSIREFVNNSNSSETESSKSARKAPKDIAVSRNIVDPDLGYSITVNRVIVNVPFDGGTSDYVTDGKVGVLVEITASNNSIFDGAIESGDFQLLYSNGTSVDEYSYNLNDFAAGNGFVLATNNRVRNGDSATVWLGFEINQNQTQSLSLQYLRTRIEIINSTKRFPRYEQTVKLF